MIFMPITQGYSFNHLVDLINFGLSYIIMLPATATLILIPVIV